MEPCIRHENIKYCTEIIFEDFIQLMKNYERIVEKKVPTLKMVCIYAVIDSMENKKVRKESKPFILFSKWPILNGIHGNNLIRKYYLIFYYSFFHIINY